MTMTSNPTDLSSSRLERQHSLALTIPRAVTIVGCGGVGSWCALFLALAGVPVLNIFDDDEVSDTNLNRLPFGAAYINLNKATAMKLGIFRAVPSCIVQAIPTRWTLDNPDLPLVAPDWIIAATDSWASRRLIYRWASACCSCHEERCGCAIVSHTPRCKYIEVSAEGEYGGCANAPAMFTTSREAEPGYQSVPVWVGPTVASAMMACAHILHAASPAWNYRLGFTSAGFVDLQQL